MIDDTATYSFPEVYDNYDLGLIFVYFCIDTGKNCVLKPVKEVF